MANKTLAPTKPKQESGFVEQFMTPLSRLRDEIDRAFDEFPTRWPALTVPSRLAALMPSPAVEMTETEKSYKVTVEVPGIPADEIEVCAERGVIVIKGEKKAEREEKERDYTRSERSYGAFERRISIPQDSDLDRIEAKATDGVLTITVPRDREVAPASRKITIKRTKKD